MSKFNDTIEHMMTEAGVFKGADKDELKKRKDAVIERTVKELKDRGTMRDGRLDVDGDVDLEELKLTELPIKFGRVTGDFLCSDNLLKSLEGCPTEVGGDFACYCNRLTTLEGAPKQVSKDFFCNNNRLESLKGAPRKVGGTFYCDRNCLVTLNGAPTEVGCSFLCDHNKLTSLKGAPTKVGSFWCNDNKLTSLEGSPSKVDGDFECRRNPGKFTEDDVRAVCKVKDRVYI